MAFGNFKVNPLNVSSQSNMLSECACKRRPGDRGCGRGVVKQMKGAQNDTVWASFETELCLLWEIFGIQILKVTKKLNANIGAPDLPSTFQETLQIEMVRDLNLSLSLTITQTGSRICFYIFQYELNRYDTR